MTRVAAKPTQAVPAGGQGRPPASPRPAKSSSKPGAPEQAAPVDAVSSSRGRTAPGTATARRRAVCAHLKRHGNGTSCGKPHDRCSGHNRRGNPCNARGVAWKGLDSNGNCKYHGGASPAGRKSAQTTSAELALKTMGVAVPIDPITGLRTAIWEAWGNVTFLRHQCELLGLELTGNVWSSTRDGDLFITHSEVLPIVRLYGEWHDRFTKACVAAAKIGLAEAEIQLARQQADIVARVVLGVIDGLNLSPKKVEEARRLFGAEFRKVAPSLNTVELS